MENRDQILYYDHLIKVLDLCAEIQNTGIATVFIDFSGHVNKTDIRLYKPVWISEMNPTHQFELRHVKDEDDFNQKRNERVINNLSELLNTGKLAEDDERKLILELEQTKRREQYEQLKKEFEPA